LAGGGAASSVELTVVGSVNLDLVARVERLPERGETLTARSFVRLPGGKGANQALAAARFGAGVRFVAAVGDDHFADEALVNLVAAGVELQLERTGETGVAFVVVDAEGGNEIVVVPGANALLTPREVEGAVLCQLEVPNEVVLAAARRASFFALNAAPAGFLDLEPDLLVVNEIEHAVFSRGKLVAVTRGAAGAVLYEGNREVARADAPKVDVVDTTGAGDAFTARLVVALLEGRPRDEALQLACAAGAEASTRLGAQ